MGRTGEKKKKVMSVKEMGDLLGIGKTDRYYVLKKGYFKVTHAAGKMWVDRESFEKWYAGQTRYHKVTGEEPGEELSARSFSVKEMAAMLGIERNRAYELIHRERIPVTWENGVIRIPRKDFWIWYDCQIKYQTDSANLPDETGTEYHFRIQELADILNISTKDAYRLTCDPAYASSLAAVQIGDRMYVSWQNFGKFLKVQNQYFYDPRRDPSVSRAGGHLFLNIRQAGWYAKVSKATIISWCKEGAFPVKWAGKNVRIPLDEFDKWLKKRKEKK